MKRRSPIPPFRVGVVKPHSGGRHRLRSHPRASAGPARTLPRRTCVLVARLEEAGLLGERPTARPRLHVDSPTTSSRSCWSPSGGRRRVGWMRRLSRPGCRGRACFGERFGGRRRSSLSGEPGGRPAREVPRAFALCWRRWRDHGTTPPRHRKLYAVRRNYADAAAMPPPTRLFPPVRHLMLAS